MHNYPFDALVFIGRFQPFHRGHDAVIQTALKQAEQVIVVVGSSGGARTTRNPFTFAERREMILAGRGDEGDRIKVVSISDFPYDDTKWIAAVQRAVSSVIEPTSKIALIGHSKDATSYYLNIFQPLGWDAIEVPNVEGINATDIRHAIFAGRGDEHPAIYAERVMGYWPKMTMDSIILGGVGRDGGAWETLCNEYEMVRRYKESWKAAPFPPTFVTTDAVVIQSGHILLIKRRAAPGKGLWALPGGFLNQEETIIDGCIRELREETKLKVPTPVLKGSIKETHVFDKPDRSSRGRTITHAFLIDLGVGELPKVKGSDDAEKAQWVPLGSVDQSLMFEDHYFIIDHFTHIGE